jgi:hypothetical protein
MRLISCVAAVPPCVEVHAFARGAVVLDVELRLEAGRVLSAAAASGPHDPFPPAIPVHVFPPEERGGPLRPARLHWLSVSQNCLALSWQLW